MSVSALDRLLAPRSIAVVGGSWAEAVVAQCLKMGFEGPIWPVHPTRPTVAGLPCYRSIDDLPNAPDATFVGVNRRASVDVVRALAARGAGGVVCFASGFAEASDDRAAGVALQADLVAAAGEMPLIGPNCYGLINYLDGAPLWPDEHGGRRVDRGVAILGQSSNILINLTMQRRGLPLAYVAAAGNQAQTGLADLGLAMIDDPRVTALGLHIEGVGDVRAFEALAARARALGKPLVAIKVGRSEQAQLATLSHTASLAGGDAASRAFLTRIGIPVVDSLPAFLGALMLGHVHGALSGRRIGAISCSGGEASLVADAAAARRLDVPALASDRKDAVQAVLSEMVTVANPLDYHTFIWGDVPRMTDCFAAMMCSGFDLTYLIYDLPRTDRCSDQAWECGIEAAMAAAARTGARAAMVTTLAENMSETRAEALAAAGVVPLYGLDEGLSAAEAMADLGASWVRPPAAPVLLSPPCSGPAETMDEAEAKAVLAAHGVRVPGSCRADSAEGAGEAAVAIGFPVALKGLGIAHKTEAGAVQLGLMSQDAVVAAAEAMPTDVFLVEEMVTDAVAELIVGVVRDPVYGFTLTIGAGGVLTELLADTATLIIPAPEDDVRAAIADLRIARILAGWRCKPAADMDAVVAQVMAVQAYAVAEAERLLELDVNPLIATPDGAVAVDALIRRQS